MGLSHRERGTSEDSQNDLATTDRSQATFTALVEAKVHKNGFAGKGLMITGKGYPDIATRRFLHDVELCLRLCPCCRAKPILGMCTVKLHPLQNPHVEGRDLTD